MNVRHLLIATTATVSLLASPATFAAPGAAPSASIAAPVAGPGSALKPLADAPTFGAKELDAAIAHLGDPDEKMRKAAAMAIVRTPPDAIPLLEVRLLRAPEAGPGPMWLVLDKVRKSMGGGKDSKDAKDAKDSKEKKESEESLEALLDGVLSSGNSAGHRSLALLLSGIEACEKQAGVAGARVLVRIAVDHKGLLKTTVTNVLKRMGDHAVAGLVEVRRDENKDLRTFANRTLDVLGKFLPSDAVQVKDPQDLADVLVAFGKIKDPDGIRVIISYLDADRTQVREAARWAIGQFGNEAKVPLKEAYDNFTGDKAGDDWPAEKTLKALVAAYDKLRLAEVYKLLDEGIANRDAGRLEEAVTSFDALLARAPTFERKAELASAYVDLAHKKLAAGDRPAARALLAKALRLGAGTPLASLIESELDTFDATDLLDHGVADVMLLRRAVELDPNNAPARDLLQKLTNDAEARQTRLRRWAAGGAAGVLATLLAILFLGRKRAGKGNDAAPPPARRRPVRI